jgi:hypothetical protein
MSMKNLMKPLGIDPGTLRLAIQSLNKLRHTVPLKYAKTEKNIENRRIVPKKYVA